MLAYVRACVRVCGVCVCLCVCACVRALAQLCACIRACVRTYVLWLLHVFADYRCLNHNRAKPFMTSVLAERQAGSQDQEFTAGEDLGQCN